MALQPVALEKAYRLINHGPTVIVSAKHDNIENAMAASWACALDFVPAKVTVVLDKAAYTRHLVENSGYFALQVPVAKQVNTVMAVGTSHHTESDKLKDHGIKVFYQDGFDVPLLEDCAAYLVCKLIPEPHNQQAHDLFIGEVVGAWADDRVFRDGHWEFDSVEDDLKTLHYIAGGQFYLIGKGLRVDGGP